MIKHLEMRNVNSTLLEAVNQAEQNVFHCCPGLHCYLHLSLNHVDFAKG